MFFCSDLQLLSLLNWRLESQYPLHQIYVIWKCKRFDQFLNLVSSVNSQAHSDVDCLASLRVNWSNRRIFVFISRYLEHCHRWKNSKERNIVVVENAPSDPWLDFPILYRLLNLVDEGRWMAYAVDAKHIHAINPQTVLSAHVFFHQLFFPFFLYSHT